MANLRSGQSCIRLVPKVTVASRVVLIMAMAAASVVEAQTYKVIYTFGGCSDGNNPTSTLTLDRSGSLYGTTVFGGSGCGEMGQGVVFRLKPSGGGWVETPIHVFTGGSQDGAGPVNYGGLTVGPDGSFYGTAANGGLSNFGVVFRLRPSVTACRTALCPWSADVLYSFAGDPDGLDPQSDVIFDSAGNIYGTTVEGGSMFGTVFEMSPKGGGWTESVIANVGGLPFAGMVIGHDGNLYGVNYEGGGSGSGLVFQLTPSGTGWTENILYTFTGRADGGEPHAGLILDPSGNIYGSTIFAGPSGGGTVFELSPSGGSWTFHTVYSFAGAAGPASTLTMDAEGNLYGTTVSDGAFSSGCVFKLTRTGNSWTYADLHDFQQGDGGMTPAGGVTLGANGNLYGTTTAGGAHGAGVVWEITP